MYEYLGQPIEEEVVPVSGDSVGPCAPEGVTEVAEFDGFKSRLYTGDIKVIDFGHSFVFGSPLPYGLGTPLEYLAPDMVVDRRRRYTGERLAPMDDRSPCPGPEADIWALGCTIYLIRTGSSLFDGFGDSEARILGQMVDLLGPLPAELVSDWNRRKIIKNVSKHETAFLSARQKVSLAERLASISEPWNSEDKDREVVQPLDGTDEDPDNGSLLERSDVPLPAEEATLLADLLGKMLRYHPQERITIEEVVSHAWFRYEG